jgi:succinate dehydrogenase/fumarate reductase-like Fe-S protein
MAIWNLGYAFSHIMAYFLFAKEIPAKLLFEQECWRGTCGSALVDITGKKYPDSSTCQGRRHSDRKHRRQAEGQGRP